jgi:integrase
VSSIHRQEGKPNLFCAFYDPEGFRRFRSTGTGNLKVARTICITIERAAALAKQGKLSNEKALKLIRETAAAIEESHGKIVAGRAEATLKPSIEEFVRLAGGELTSFTTRAWLNHWLEGRTDASKATLIEYRRVIDLFFAFLGARADRAMTTLQPLHVEDFKKHLLKRVGPSTVDKAIKVLKAAFSAAVSRRHLEFSPAQHVELNKEEGSSRRPFTREEISKLCKAAEGDWFTMLLLGYYSAQRLTDCANLSWRKVDLLKSTIKFATKKTGRDMVIPIADPLLKHLNTLAGDDPDAPLCPALYGKRVGWLSAQFYKLMVAAGLVPKRTHAKTKNGRDAKRETNPISFHSLRYNATSDLKSGGVSDSVAMDIVGHESEAVSRDYTKISEAAKREAINKLPDITK